MANHSDVAPLPISSGAWPSPSGYGKAKKRNAPAISENKLRLLAWPPPHSLTSIRRWSQTAPCRRMTLDAGSDFFVCCWISPVSECDKPVKCNKNNNPVSVLTSHIGSLELTNSVANGRSPPHGGSARSTQLVPGNTHSKGHLVLCCQAARNASSRPIQSY